MRPPCRSPSLARLLLIHMCAASKASSVVVAPRPSTFEALDDYDDFHYPSEEPAERAVAEASMPRLVDVQQAVSDTSRATLACGTGGLPTNLSIGQSLRCGSCSWRLNAVWENTSSPSFAAELADKLAPVAFAAVEHSFSRWGLLAIISSDVSSSPVSLRKSVGSLSAIKQPWYNLTDSYLSNVSASLEDLPTVLARNHTMHGEPDYNSIAATLAPQRDTVAISHAADVVKFAVAYSGRVKCASTGILAEGTSTGGIAELQDLRAPLPNTQKVSRAHHANRRSSRRSDSLVTCDATLLLDNLKLTRLHYLHVRRCVHT